MKHSFFRIPVLFINFADDNRNGSHVSLFTLLMEREFFNHPNRFILQCDNGEWSKPVPALHASAIVRCTPPHEWPHAGDMVNGAVAFQLGEEYTLKFMTFWDVDSMELPVTALIIRLISLMADNFYEVGLP